MTRKEFIDSMKRFIKLRETEEKIHEALQGLDSDGFCSFTMSNYESLVIDLLKKVMNDKDEWISYWFYELERGKNATNDSVRDKDNKPIPIKTLNDLYNLINNKEV